MDTQRIIQCIGTNEEDTAHLRLLLRVTRTQVRDGWTWGPESKADLVIVDTRKLIGDSAMRRAAQRGIACAQVLKPSDPTPTAGLYLRKPFRREALVTLLNKVGRDTGPGEDEDTWSDEFMEALDLGHVDLSALEADHPGLHGGYAPPGGPREEMDEEHERKPSSGPSSDSPRSQLAGSPLADTQDQSAKSDSSTDRTASDTTLASTCGDAPGGQTRVQDVSDPSIANEVEPDVDLDATYPLIYYLEKSVLRGPAKITLRGMPTLVLDPNEKFFWAKGLLPALEPYAREPLRFGDWQRLTRIELVEASRGIAARPFARLIWMDTFIHSKGFLAKHFDPGGNYLLTNRLDFTLDYPRAVRVGALLTTPRKLHEIARVTGVGLAEVFDIINAYEAIGYVEWTPRESPPRKGR